MSTQITNNKNTKVDSILKRLRKFTSKLTYMYMVSEFFKSLSKAL